MSYRIPTLFLCTMPYISILVESTPQLTSPISSKTFASHTMLSHTLKLLYLYHMSFPTRCQFYQIEATYSWLHATCLIALGASQQTVHELSYRKLQIFCLPLCSMRSNDSHRRVVDSRATKVSLGWRLFSRLCGPLCLACLRDHSISSYL